MKSHHAFLGCVAVAGLIVTALGGCSSSTNDVGPLEDASSPTQPGTDRPAKPGPRDSGSTGIGDAAPPGADGGTGRDAGPRRDGGPVPDAGPGPDAGPARDAGTGADGGPWIDAGGDGGLGTGEEGTVGKPCAATADCNVPGTVNDNVCSNAAFTTGDVLSTPVCIQPSCTQGAGGTIDDLLCDATNDGAGLCLPVDAMSAVCLPFCAFDSARVDPTTQCAGNNVCSIAYSAQQADGTALGLGTCEGACKVDADCKGTPGQVCEAETGRCVLPANKVTYPKTLGQPCARSTTGGSPECACMTGGDPSGNGTCSKFCVTGDATACGAGFECTAALPAQSPDGTTLFTGTPDGLAGSCMKPCNADADCTSLVAAGVTIHCAPVAGGKKYCTPGAL